MDTVEAEKIARRRRISEEISDAMEHAGMSRKELALKMHRMPSEVTRWLGGKCNFTSDTLAELSSVLGIQISGTPLLTGSLVEGYGSSPEDGGAELHDSRASMIPGIALPADVVQALASKASRSGHTLREYIVEVLCLKSKEREADAFDFCGIWDEDCPDYDELKALRSRNTFPEL